MLDGPFTEAKELIAGFTMIEVASRAEAIEWMKQWPPEDGHGNVELELRQIATAEDFGDAMTARTHRARGGHGHVRSRRTNDRVAAADPDLV